MFELTTVSYTAYGHTCNTQQNTGATSATNFLSIANIGCCSLKKKRDSSRNAMFKLNTTSYTAYGHTCNTQQNTGATSVTNFLCIANVRCCCALKRKETHEETILVLWEIDLNYAMLTPSRQILQTAFMPVYRATLSNLLSRPFLIWHSNVAMIPI